MKFRWQQTAKATKSEEERGRRRRAAKEAREDKVEEERFRVREKERVRTKEKERERELVYITPEIVFGMRQPPRGINHSICVKSQADSDIAKYLYCQIHTGSADEKGHSLGFLQPVSLQMEIRGKPPTMVASRRLPSSIFSPFTTINISAMPLLGKYDQG